MSTSTFTKLKPLLAGMVVGVVPMLIASAMPLRHGRHIDPFDQGFAYAVWIIGMFIVSAALAYREPERAKANGLFVGAGLPVAMMIFSAMTTGVPSMWPLALIVCAVVAFPPAMAGAWLGGRLASGRIKRIGA